MYSAEPLRETHTDSPFCSTVLLMGEVCHWPGALFKAESDNKVLSGKSPGGVVTDRSLSVGHASGFEFGHLGALEGTDRGSNI